MSHQPFEAWLLVQDELTGEQASSLQEHLADCQACASLAAALGEVELELRSAEPLRPAPGFAARWRVRQAVAVERRQARQAWAALGIAIGLTLGLTAVLVLGVLASPADLAARGLQTLAGWVVDAGLVWNVVRTVFGSLPETISLASGFGLALGLMVGLVGMAAAWFITVHRFALPVHRQGVTR